MSKAHIGATLRHQVIDRASGCCEYCLADTKDRVVDFAIDHVIAEKHGGPTQIDNLCLSCYWCNSFKAAISVQLIGMMTVPLSHYSTPAASAGVTTFDWMVCKLSRLQQPGV